MLLYCYCIDSIANHQTLFLMSSMQCKICTETDLYTVPVVFVGTTRGDQTGEGDSFLHCPATDSTGVVARQVLLVSGVGPAGGHEDVVSVDHLPPQAAGQVEHHRTEWLPAACSKQ